MTDSDITTISIAATTQADPWPVLRPFVAKYGNDLVAAVVLAARRTVVEPSPLGGGMEEWIKL